MFIDLVSSIKLFLKAVERVFTIVNLFFSHHTAIICSSMCCRTSFSGMIKGDMWEWGTKKFQGRNIPWIMPWDLTNFLVSISHLCWVCMHQKFCRVSCEIFFRQIISYSPLFLNLLITFDMVWKNQKSWEYWLVGF